LLGLFALIALSVELGWWAELDHSVNEWAATQRGTLIWHASKVVFDVATPQIALAITLVMACLVAWKRHRWEIAVEGAVRISVVVVAVLLLKPLLAVPGPTRDALGDHGGSFPSGHTTATVVCVALLFGCIGWPRPARGRVAGAALIAAFVGVAVIYVRYHYLSDVVGGIVLGLLIATFPFPQRGKPSSPE